MPACLEFGKAAARVIKSGELCKLPDKFFSYPQTKYLPLRRPDLSLLSGREIEAIDRVLDRLSDMTAAIEVSYRSEIF